jgi:hypothetical protein
MFVFSTFLSYYKFWVWVIVLRIEVTSVRDERMCMQWSSEKVKNMDRHIYNFVLSGVIFLSPKYYVSSTFSQRAKLRTCNFLKDLKSEALVQYVTNFTKQNPSWGGRLIYKFMPFIEVWYSFIIVYTIASRTQYTTSPIFLHDDILSFTYIKWLLPFRVSEFHAVNNFCVCSEYYMFNQSWFCEFMCAWVLQFHRLKFITHTNTTN